ncbi:MAG: SUMF1/EgtB/PvdO family nonheme iron enzyme [Chloroflexi bacterium]|nr:SUMF1/EgtB/PvdO family nonheme iron enzyme [Chloroflexota bacterium]
MDPFILQLAGALAIGIATVGNKLIEKAVVEPLLKPAAEKIKLGLEAHIKPDKRDAEIAQAIRQAAKDAAKNKDDSVAVKYMQRLSLQMLAEPENAGLRDEIVRLMLLVSSADDADIIPALLLQNLRLSSDQRPALATFLFYLRQRLNALEDFQPLFEAAHDQRVENALRQMETDLSTLSRTVENTADGKALRVREVKADWNPELYLKYLAAECNRLNLSAVDPNEIKASGRGTVSLIDVYTDLEVTTPVREDQAEKKSPRARKPMAEEMLARGEARRMTALEAVAQPDKQCIVLLGDPGGGKSTFVNYLAYALAMEQLEPKAKWLARLTGWKLEKLVPVRVILREFIAWAGADRKANAQALWDFIAEELTGAGHEKHFDPLKEHLLQKGGIVLLDGLDEVADAHARREFVKKVVQNFAQACPLVRLVVTSRPYAYRDEKWKLEAFEEHSLAPFSAEQIEKFVHAWYNKMQEIGQVNADKVNLNVNALIHACARPDLRKLAERPLLLTLMATLHTWRAGQLPDDRATLYQDCVNLMLAHWEEARRQKQSGVEQIEKGILQTLGITQTNLQKALSQVAFDAHTRQAQAQNRNVDTADISADELRRSLVPALQNDWNKANALIQYIQTRAGLIFEKSPDSETSPGVYSFSHRTFQEFLAACYLTGKKTPEDLANLVRQDRDWWREVFLLAVGRAEGFHAVAIINALCPRPYRRESSIADADAYAAALAAQGAAEIHLHTSLEDSPTNQETLAKLQHWLVAIITQGALPLKERAEAARTLSALGDLRGDVISEISVTLAVPAGEFIMGSNDYDNEKPPHRVTLKEYRIGKYPVTNSQFRRFIDAGGYQTKALWTDAGWEWREKNSVAKPDYWDDPQWNLENHPVVGVSWYESVAYCNWLTETNPGREFRLPTEAEWEKAARGPSTSSGDLREYPWVGDFDPEKANTAESGIGRTTAVGLFPRGASQYGALDMAGNVWEWCSSRWGKNWEKPDFKYPYRLEDGREDLKSNDLRVLRGGAWDYNQGNARCANRGGSSPHDRNDSVGFRVAESFSKST